MDSQTWKLIRWMDSRPFGERVYSQIFRKESIRRRWMDSLSFSAVVKNTFWKKTLRESIRRTFFINLASPFGHFRVHSANFRIHSATLLIDSASFRVHSAAIRAHSAWIRVHSAGESIRQKIVDTFLNYIGRFSTCNNFLDSNFPNHCFLR